MQVLAAQFRNSKGEVRIGRVLEDDAGQTVVDAGPAGPEGFVPTGDAWRHLEAANGPAHLVSEVTILHPVVPSKLLCIGLNYLAHARESNLELPQAPLIFVKVNSALIGNGEPIVIPPQEPEPDFEAEVAVVIGTRAKNVTVDDALEYVGGVTALNDVSGRSAQFGDGQWTRGKGYDTFAPLGPYVAKSDLMDLKNVGVRCTLSGEIMQESSTADLIFSIAELVSYVSHQFTLNPGDVIATGTPSGVGIARTPRRLLQSGDVVEVWVEGVGTLTNPVA